MNTNPSPLHPTTPQLLKATAGAALIAAVLLVIAVLPAEYGRDPTGLGRILGLTALNAVAPAEASLNPTGTPPTAQNAVIPSETPFQNGEMQVTLRPGEGTEVKALMQSGEALVFSWTADAPVNFDMHGEKPNDGNNYTSYWRDRAQTSAHGSFTAPYDGTHGWYWKNPGTMPVNVTVKVSGYYQKLYQPQ
ncbi:MAG: hypothetical protein ACLGIW_00500 [Gammaproteobacteria bacterium]